MQDLLIKVVQSLVEKNLTIGFVESCTGGKLSAKIVSVPGAPATFSGSIVTYSNALKTKLANVNEKLIESCGAVSQEVAKAMAAGGKSALDVDVCISVTGIAGPGGGTSLKPVGTVWIGFACKDLYFEKKFLFHGTRDAIQDASVSAAIRELLMILEKI